MVTGDYTSEKCCPFERGIESMLTEMDILIGISISVLWVFEESSVS